jgi:hypothetical protein
MKNKAEQCLQALKRRVNERAQKSDPSRVTVPKIFTSLKNPNSDHPDNEKTAPSRKSGKYKRLIARYFIGISFALSSGCAVPANNSTGENLPDQTNTIMHETPVPNMIREVERAPEEQEALNELGLLSREELLERFGIVIHDLPRDLFPDNYVELEFRSSALENRLFQMLQERRLNGLYIFLINSDRVDPAAFTDAQREFMSEHPTILAGLEREIERIRELNRQEILEYGPRMREEHSKKLAYLESIRPTLTEDRYSVELQALNYMYSRYLADNPREEDLYEMAIRGYAPTKGTGENARGEVGPQGFVFLAVRDKNPEVTFVSGTETLIIPSSRIPYGNSDSTAEYPNRFSPRPEQSFPSLQVLQIADEPDANGYLIIGGLTPGVILRHELKHIQGIIAEDGADRATLQDIMLAFAHMQETGNDDKYWIVFITPEGITLTRNATESLREPVV